VPYLGSTFLRQIWEKKENVPCWSCMLRFVNLPRARSALSCIDVRLGDEFSYFRRSTLPMLFNQRNAQSLRTPKHEGLNGGVWPHVWQIQIHAQRKPALMDSRPAGGGRLGSPRPIHTDE
jgi:hypothetical protein